MEGTPMKKCTKCPNTLSEETQGHEDINLCEDCDKKLCEDIAKLKGNTTPYP